MGADTRRDDGATKPSGGPLGARRRGVGFVCAGWTVSESSSSSFLPMHGRFNRTGGKRQVATHCCPGLRMRSLRPCWANDLDNSVDSAGESGQTCLANVGAALDALPMPGKRLLEYTWKTSVRMAVQNSTPSLRYGSSALSRSDCI